MYEWVQLAEDRLWHFEIITTDGLRWLTCGLTFDREVPLKAQNWIPKTKHICGNCLSKSRRVKNVSCSKQVSGVRRCS